MQINHDLFLNVLKLLLPLDVNYQESLIIIRLKYLTLCNEKKPEELVRSGRITNMLKDTRTSYQITF